MSDWKQRSLDAPTLGFCPWVGFAVAQWPQAEAVRSEASPASWAKSGFDRPYGSSGLTTVCLTKSKPNRL